MCLLCPRAATWPPGHAHVLISGHLVTWACLFTHMHWDMVARSYLFACLPQPRVTEWCPGHTCLKAFFVPGAPCGRLDMAVGTRTLLRQCDLMFTGMLRPGILICLFTHMEFPRAAIWWHCFCTYTWQSRHACHKPAMSQHYHLVAWVCLF